MYITLDLLSTATLGCIKIGALLFFRRIFCVSGRRTYFNYITLATILIVTLWTIGFIILAPLQCGSHFSALWTGKADYARYCTHTWQYLLGFTISDFLLDLWIICLPLPQVIIPRQ